MVVKIKKGMSGPKVSYKAGQEVDLPDAKAEIFIARGLADPVPVKVEIKKPDKKVGKKKVHTR